MLPKLHPRTFGLVDFRKWIGYLPTYDPVSGAPTVPGSGLLGIPFLVGPTAGKLNSLCHDAAAGFRSPGLFDTDSGQYDGGVVSDIHRTAARMTRCLDSRASLP